MKLTLRDRAFLVQDWLTSLVCRVRGHVIVHVPHSAGCYRLDHRGLPDESMCTRCQNWL